MDGWMDVGSMDGQTDVQKDSDLTAENVHRREQTELHLRGWRKRAGFPTWDLRNSPVSTAPGRKLPGWTVRNCGEGTPRGLTVRPGAAGQVQARPVLLCRPAQTRRSTSPSALRRQWWPGQPPSEGALGDPKVYVAAASARGLGTGHLQDTRSPGLWKAGSTTPLSRGHSPTGCSPAPVTPSRFPLGPAPPGDRPQALARRVLVRDLVSVFCLRRRDLGHRPG